MHKPTGARGYSGVLVLFACCTASPAESESCRLSETPLSMVPHTTHVVLNPGHVEAWHTSYLHILSDCTVPGALLSCMLHFPGWMFVPALWHRAQGHRGCCGFLCVLVDVGCLLLITCTC
jgi:hypothetical protein